MDAKCGVLQLYCAAEVSEQPRVNHCHHLPMSDFARQVIINKYSMEYVTHDRLYAICYVYTHTRMLHYLNLAYIYLVHACQWVISPGSMKIRLGFYLKTTSKPNISAHFVIISIETENNSFLPSVIKSNRVWWFG